MTHTITLTDTGRVYSVSLLFERTATGVKVSTHTGDGDQAIQRRQGVLPAAGAQELAAWLEERDAA